MSYKAKAIANTFLNKSFEHGNKLTPLKLQKLMYYACGYYEAAYEKTLFLNRKIEAWDYGPVIPEIYNEFRNFGSSEINRLACEYDPETGERVPVAIPTEDDELKRVIDFVWDNYSKYSAIQLSEMTHTIDSPWDLTRKSQPEIKNADISTETIQEYFKKLIRKN